MYSTGHLALGLILGKLTGDYPTAIISSVAIDLDHLIPYAQQGIIFSPKKMWKAAKTPHASSRGILHSFFAWAILSGIICLVNLEVGLVFSLGILGHFLLDALDGDDFYPFYPIKKMNTKGFIGYYSRKELFLTIVLFIIYFLI